MDRDATTGQMPRKLNTTLLFSTQDLDGPYCTHLTNACKTMTSSDPGMTSVPFRLRVNASLDSFNKMPHPTSTIVMPRRE